MKMSKTWYPVINKEKCTECLICVNHCKHGAYEERDGKPYVINPENCVHGCHGCGNKCPVGAIEYVGDTTDWIPPNGKKDNISDCGCGGGYCCG